MMKMFDEIVDYVAVTNGKLPHIQLSALAVCFWLSSCIRPSCKVWMSVLNYSWTIGYVDYKYGYVSCSSKADIEDIVYKMCYCYKSITPCMFWCFRASETEADWLSYVAENHAGTVWASLQNIPHGRRSRRRSHIWCKSPFSFFIAINEHVLIILQLLFPCKTNKVYAQVFALVFPIFNYLLGFGLKILFASTRWRSISSLRCLSSRVSSPS